MPVLRGEGGGGKDSIEHTFLNARLRGPLFNEANCCQISPTTKELLFGIIPGSKETKIIQKINYTTLSMRHYIYSNKVNNKGIYMYEFINKLSLKVHLTPQIFFG